jgi:hypothetical protein
MPDYFLTSVARITDFAQRPLDELPLPRSEWETGDYVLAEVLDSGPVPYFLEDPTGRAVGVLPGDVLVGALGRRFATLEVVGDWRAVGDDLHMDGLTAAGVLGKCTSAAFPRPPMASLRYRGHAARERVKTTMSQFVRRPDGHELEAPVVLIVGTSMSSGKTVAARAIVRALKRLGLRVSAAKLTGVARYRDVLAARDAGADRIADFVDVGLPSTVVPRAEYEPALRLLLSLIAEGEPDVVVAEAGASPLEPYNGDAAVSVLGDRVRCIVLCASDPYAVVGVMSAFGIEPDLVSGRATSTEAGIALVDKLCGVKALNLIDPASHAELSDLLGERLDLV